MKIKKSQLIDFSKARANHTRLPTNVKIHRHKFNLRLWPSEHFPMIHIIESFYLTRYDLFVLANAKLKRQHKLSMKFQLALKELNVKLKDDYGPGNIKGVGVTIDLPAIDMVRLYEIHVSNTEKIKRAMTEDNDAVNFKLFQKHKRKMRRRLMRLARNFQRWYKRGYHVYENQPLVYEMTEFLLAAEKDKENSGKAW